MSRLLVFDIALVAVLVLGGAKVVKDWGAFAPNHDLAAVQPPPQTFPALPAAVPSTAGTEDWSPIYTANPFSFDRNDVTIVVAAEAPAQPIGPKPVLFGTMLIGSERTAILAPSGGASGVARPMKTGEVIDGWTIVEITASSIRLESSGVLASVIMNDPAAQIPRDYGRTQSTGGGGVLQPSASSSTSTFLPPLPATATTPAPAVPGQQQRPTRVVQTPFGPRTIFTDIP